MLAMSKTLSMRTALHSIMEYVATMVTLLDAGDATALKVEQAAKASAIIANCKVDVNNIHDDGVAAIALLNGTSCPWSVDESAQIISAIRTNVEGHRQKTGDQQDIANIENWFPEWIWELARSHCNLDHVFEHMSSYSVTTLKLRNPSEICRRDMIALVFSLRQATPTVSEASDNIDKLRRHFEAARSLHSGPKGPSVYPADPSVFTEGAGILEKDLPVPSKVSLHAFTASKMAVKCRNRKSAPATVVSPGFRARGKQHQASLKDADALDNLANYVLGKIQTDDVSTLPGVANLLQGEKAKSEQSVSMSSGPSSGHVKEEQISPPTVAAPFAGSPSLQALRELTRAKFAKLGIELDDEGRAKGEGVAKGTKRRTAAASMKRPAAACSSDSKGDDDSEDNDGSEVEEALVKMRPAAAASTPFAVSVSANLPKGWAFALKTCNDGKRSYPVWTSPTGRRFYSWKGLQKTLTRKSAK